MKHNQEYDKQTPLISSINGFNLSSQYQTHKRHILDQSLIKCIQSQQAIQFCLNPKCFQQNGFICCSLKCKCNILHKKCQKGNISITLQTINQKLDGLKDLKQYIDLVVENQIDRISKVRESFIKIVQEQTVTIMLTDIQSKFYKLFNKDQQPQPFNGEYLSRLWQSINNENRSNTKIDYIKQALQAFSKQTIKSLRLLQNQVRSIVSQQERVVNSSIIDNQIIFKKLIGMFDSPVKSLHLLYKASAHKFSLQKYYQLCGCQNNTIIVCKNQYNKILGGYTPLQFNAQVNQPEHCYIHDTSGTSFVFSLSNNQKFAIKQKQNAIYRPPNKDYIYFGWGFFRICDNADKVLGSCLFFGKEIYDTLYYKHDRESYAKVNGSQICDFLLQQWEVIKVQF